MWRESGYLGLGTCLPAGGKATSDAGEADVIFWGSAGNSVSEGPFFPQVDVSESTTPPSFKGA